ncbi:MAG: SOS response-associated peptidase [Chitinophagales bacterium]
MCYHYSNKRQKHDAAKQREIGAETAPDYNGTIYHANGFTHPAMPVITQQAPHLVQMMAWGDFPGNYNQLNARAETVFERPAYHQAILTHRCLIEATGFFEWRAVKRKKIPYFISVKDDAQPQYDRYFYFGGLYTEWKDTNGIAHRGFSILTTEANALMAEIHNTKKRMPFILPTSTEATWLNPMLTHSDIEKLMQPYAHEKMRAYTISPLITSRQQPTNVPEVLQPLMYPELSAEQGRLLL